SSVYGDAKELPITENTPKKPISPYGVTKLAAENLCNLYYINYGVPTVSLRYFTVYGPRQRPDMAINKFVKAILHNKTIEVYGDGTQTRDFTYVSDVIQANLLAAKSKSKVNGEVFNIGGGSRISVKELIKLLESTIGKIAKVTYSDKQKGDVRHTYADISKAKKMLGYNPEVSIHEGIKKYLQVKET
ncbi:MAG: GDP-mannose 4,6-dehydratase, partial [Methanosarcinales archaeon]